jgi:predicted N-formylglutamate amidohydrolase
MVDNGGALAMSAESWKLLGEPRFGGVLVVSDHASNRVPADIALGIAPALLDQHIAVDIGVAGVGALLARRPGIASFQANVSRLVCDFNRDEQSPAIVPIASDGHAIPGNRLDKAKRNARIERFYRPYHAALDDVLNSAPPALILSIHSFTPSLATNPGAQRPWHVGVLYNEDDRGARLALPLLEAEGLTVGDQEPYSGTILNYTMNRHAEAEGRPYLGIEIRQDEIADAAGQAVWSERLGRIANAVALALGE